MRSELSFLLFKSHDEAGKDWVFESIRGLTGSSFSALRQCPRRLDRICPFRVDGLIMTRYDKGARKKAKIRRRQTKSPMCRARQLVLEALGFKRYFPDYVTSPLWIEIRSEVLRLAHHKCCACPDRAIQVHHMAYDFATMSGNDLSRLRAICPRCHNLIEFKAGKKVSLAEANVRLLMLLKGKKL